MALISKLANAYAQLTMPAGQRFSAAMDNPRGRSLNLPAAQRKSQAVMDLAGQTPEQEGLDLDMAEEQKRRKQLLDAQRSGIMSAAWLSLQGNQY